MGGFCCASVLGILIHVRVKEFSDVETALKSRTFSPLEASGDSHLKAYSLSMSFSGFFLLISDAALLSDCSIAKLSQFTLFSVTYNRFIPILLN